MPKRARIEACSSPQRQEGCRRTSYRLRGSCIRYRLLRVGESFRGKAREIDPPPAQRRRQNEGNAEFRADGRVGTLFLGEWLAQHAVLFAHHRNDPACLARHKAISGLEPESRLRIGMRAPA